SVQCLVSAGAGAAGRNRKRGRRSRVPVLGAAGLCSAGRGLRRAWLPQTYLLPERHFPAELPTEHLHRLPVPSTSFPCRAWFYRRRDPFFCGREAAVEEGFIPSQQSFLVQPAQQGTPGIKPDTLLLPLLQSPPAGRGRGKLIRQKPPSRTGLQNPQNPFETGPIRGWRSSTFVASPLRLREQRPNQLPLLVRQQLLPSLHDRSSTPHLPHA